MFCYFHQTSSQETLTFFLFPSDREKPKVVFCPKRIFKVSYSSDPVWVNMTRPIFTDNVGIVEYRPPLIDGIYLNHGRRFSFKAIDASGNYARCDFQVIVGGEKEASNLYLIAICSCTATCVIGHF